jgi:hypothetical protein
VRRLLFKVLALICIGSAWFDLPGAEAQWSVAAFGGPAIPTGNSRGAYQSGWMAGASGAYRFGGGHSTIGVRLDLAYSENAGKDPSPGVPADLTLKNVYGLGYLILHILPPEKSKVDAYFGGGGGIVRVEEVFGSTAPAPFTSQTFTSTNGAMSGLLGLAVPVAQSVRIFAEGRFITIFTNDSGTNLFPALIGVEFVFGGL